MRFNSFIKEEKLNFVIYIIFLSFVYIGFSKNKYDSNYKPIGKVTTKIYISLVIILTKHN